MKRFGHIFFSLLILFGALHPVAYADCCNTESESACCTLNARHGHEEGEEKSLQQANACHIQKAFPDGMAHFSCCAHLPVDFIESYTIRHQDKVQELLTGNWVLSESKIFFESIFNRTHSFQSKDCFGNLLEPPFWLSFRNIRC